MTIRPINVALIQEGEENYNTLVIQVVDLVVPLEFDLDDDPENPDTIRLRSEDGGYERQLRGDDPDVGQDGDNSLLLYCFKDVPIGVYVVEVLVKNIWIPVVESLEITLNDVTRGEVSFTDDAFDGSKLGTPEEDWEDEEEDEQEEIEIEAEEALDEYDLSFNDEDDEY